MYAYVYVGRRKDLKSNVLPDFPYGQQVTQRYRNYRIGWFMNVVMQAVCDMATCLGFLSTFNVQVFSECKTENIVCNIKLYLIKSLI